MLLTLLGIASLSAGPWGTRAPAQLPSVTVRWEDPEQEDVVIVEGARYMCRVSTLPARILSLSVDGKELLGPAGMELSVVDADGRRLTPAPPDVTPEWNVWRSQQWRPATSARARMNVWNASPYYYDAHILDIPLVSEDTVRTYRAPAPPPAAEFDLTADNGDCKALHNVTMGRAPDGAMRLTPTGPDPYVALPTLDVQGPVRVVIRMRNPLGGDGAVYWATSRSPQITGGNVTTFPTTGDGGWHEYAVQVPSTDRVTALRFDPPGEAGNVDIAWVRIVQMPPPGQRPQPVRGEMVFHAQPERLGIEMRVSPASGMPAPRAVVVALGAQPRSISLQGRTLLELGAGRSGAVALLAPGGKLSSRAVEMPAGQAWLVLRPGDGRAPEHLMAEEISPLPASAVAMQGGHWLGYDPPSGLYKAELAYNGAAFAFDPAFHNPTRQMTLDMDVTNNGVPRRMLMKLETSTGNLEAAVLTDPFGFVLPTAAFVCKNFAGEMEEPDDAGYGDIYYPLDLDSGRRARFRVHPLTHGWGIWPLKQVSSIRFFLIYWHCSTGASETTCWSMDWMQTLGAIFEIPDFRPMSGPFWATQPQHDCQHWPGWLQYNGTKGRLCYERTVFDSVAPNLARFTMLYHTSDRSATARVEAWEAPQRDEMRTMVRLRYDWRKPCAIEGDARRNFRWINMSYFRGRNDLLLWSGADGATVQRQVPGTGDFVLLGEPMAKDAPFMAGEGPGDKYNVLSLVTRFRARLGGKEYDRPVLSAAFDDQDASAWLTVAAEKLVLQPGDFLEADVMLMPHGEPTPPGFKAERERRRFGLQPVRIDVSKGRKVADYPPQVRAEGDVAAFHLEGGHGDLPVIVDGLKGWKLPMLWTNGVWQDHQVHGGDGYQVQPDGNGGYRAVFTVPHRDGQKYDLIVTRAECSSEITRAFDMNGYLHLQAETPGQWRLKAPACFGPGRNRVIAGDPVIEFSGTGKSARQLPLHVETNGRTAVINVEDWTQQRIVVTTSGAARLSFSGLLSGGKYTVAMDGRRLTRAALRGTLTVDAGAACRIVISPVMGAKPATGKRAPVSGS